MSVISDDQYGLRLVKTLRGFTHKNYIAKCDVRSYNQCKRQNNVLDLGLAHEKQVIKNVEYSTLSAVQRQRDLFLRRKLHIVKIDELSDANKWYGLVGKRPPNTAMARIRTKAEDIEKNERLIRTAKSEQRHLYNTIRESRFRNKPQSAHAVLTPNQRNLLLRVEQDLQFMRFETPERVAQRKTNEEYMKKVSRASCISKEISLSDSSAAIEI